MSDGITVNVKINDKALKRMLDNLIDDKTMLEVHNALARYCDPYVPMREGTLSQTIQITPKYVRYYLPYAHYQYTGELYLAANGSSWAKAGEKKYPSGKPLNYSKEQHPLASKEWDKAMMAANGEAFLEEVKRILVERARELYG